MKRDVEEEFADFVRVVSPRLLTSAWMLSGDPHVAEELVQESLARVYTHWRRARADNPVAYARRVLVNLHTDRWRKRRQEVLTDTVPEADQSPGHGDRVDLALDLVRVLQALPRRERECVVLRHYLDLSEKDAATTLGVSTGTVKSSTSRGLAALRAALTEGERNHV
ncbi:MAG: SigE family RNA polymerase sigma factor [Ornithinimicrobium sp.]|jgi:RNA polymerase sigma-70 factor (sigma-E family)|uniref:RNA polymerase sigma-70 factor, sigma-E family n=1 Tax=Ornithinimicrobium cerasi TaxID=2248773 RepID=A0A285VT18_9MICO|nr:MULTISPECIES: SigE family RNA polymerase sigma factor [Ornithinimicrobium]MDO5740787.1 SigE family RNA polymerase sigma factor [Ornithinimicrobium sp.]SOC57093.1 RNA polymerase sigma-70 factor, sigma-E family [Ornithinimicrobium cerasi]